MALVTGASGIVEVYTSLLDPDFISFGWIPRSGIAGSHGTSIFRFFEEGDGSFKKTRAVLANKGMEKRKNVFYQQSRT